MSSKTFESTVDLISTEDYSTLMAPWRAVVGDE